MPLELPNSRHRFEPLLTDPPIMPGGIEMQMDPAMVRRLAHFVDMVGLRKTAAPAIKRWPPPARLGHQPGATGYWVPIDTPDPPEVAVPDPARLTREERDWLRERLAQIPDGGDEVAAVSDEEDAWH